MTTAAKVLARLTFIDDVGVTRNEVDDEVDIAAVVGSNGRRDTVNLINGFTALSAPPNAQGLIIRFVSGAFTFTLKGVTGDAGIALSSVALARHPVMLPLPGAGTPILGLACTGAGVVDVIWY